MNDLKKSLDEVAATQYIDKIMSRKRRYFSRDIGKHIRVEMHTYLFGINLSYSFDEDDEFPNLITLTFGMFSLVIDW